ncbi:MAG: branched-chain amino acid transporter permease [Modestobacter sp.]|nr:branched-chain amino acid transporter permease [Modestobacter sp.]
MDTEVGTRPDGQEARPTRAGRLRALLSAENVIAVVLFVALFYVPYFLVGFPVYVLPQYMLFGVLALTLCLLWGFGGMVSFGQAAFFAIGAYALGVTLRDVGGPTAPWLGLLLALGLGVVLAAVIGWFLFSADVRDSYFVLVTLALSTITQVLANSESQLTGGFNGMFVERVTLPFGVVDVSLAGDLAAYYVIFAFTLLCYLLFRYIQWSAFGRVLVSIRENEDRSRALGYNTALYKTVAFAVSGGVAAVAGALYATDAGFVSPTLGGVLFSTSVVVWVAIGGRHYFIGALIGGIGISILSQTLNARIPEYWQLLLGLLFVVAVGFFRRGIVGTILELPGRMRSRRG